MRLTRVVPVAAAIGGVVLSASACGSSTGANTITLTSAEVTEVFTELASALGGTGVTLDQTRGGMFLPARADMANTATATTISVTANCSGGGGTVGVSGSVTPSSSGASFTLTESLNACQTTNFRVGGSINLNGSASSTQTSSSFNETVTGSLDITRKSDGQHGTCAINFSLNGTVSSTGTSVTASGTICEVNANGIV